MSNDNKTLADVQPGGRVRLATVPYDRARDLIGDAYNAGTHGIGYSQQAMELHDAIIPVQPTPGGQDALHEAARRVISDIDSGDYGGTISMATYDALVAALAARQPVGEPEIWVSPGQLEELKRRPAGQGSNYLPTRLASEGNFTQPLYAAPPAQAVDLDELRRAVCVVNVVGQIDGHDVVRRNSLLDVIDNRRQRLTESQVVQP